MLYNEKWEKPAVKLEPWQQHLLDAAAYLREHGWCQHSAFFRGQACVLGALSETMLSHGDNHETHRMLVSHLGFSDSSDLVHWNDQRGRTKEEVIAALEAAAKGE